MRESAATKVRRYVTAGLQDRPHKSEREVRGNFLTHPLGTFFACTACSLHRHLCNPIRISHTDKA